MSDNIKQLIMKELQKHRCLYRNERKYKCDVEKILKDSNYFYNNFRFPRVSTNDKVKNKRIQSIKEILGGKTLFQKRNFLVNLEDMLDLVKQGTPVDVINYGSFTNIDIRLNSILDIDEELKSKIRIKNALNFLGIEVRNDYIGHWKGGNKVEIFKERVSFGAKEALHFFFMNKEPQYKLHRINKLDNSVPLIIVEDFNRYGIKHNAMVDFLIGQGYGLDLKEKGQLAFSYIGQTVTHPQNPTLLHDFKVL